MNIFFKSFLILIAILTSLVVWFFGTHYLAEFLEYLLDFNRDPRPTIILLFLIPISALYLLIVLHHCEMKRYDFKEDKE